MLHSRLARNINKADACALIGVKKGPIFSLIYFVESFCIYFIPHNFVIPQAMDPCHMPFRKLIPPFTLTEKMTSVSANVSCFVASYEGD